MIKDYLKADKQLQRTSYGGTGPVELYELWENADFESNIDFIDCVVVPPGSTIGFHKHGRNEEMYIILGGTGLMKIEESDISVLKDDMILNPDAGSHGLTNNFDGNIEVLIFQV